MSEKNFISSFARGSELNKESKLLSSFARASESNTESKLLSAFARASESSKSINNVPRRISKGMDLEM